MRHENVPEAVPAAAGHGRSQSKRMRPQAVSRQTHTKQRGAGGGVHSSSSQELTVVPYAPTKKEETDAGCNKNMQNPGNTNPCNRYPNRGALHRGAIVERKPQKPVAALAVAVRHHQGTSHHQEKTNSWDIAPRSKTARHRTCQRMVYAEWGGIVGRISTIAGRNTRHSGMQSTGSRYVRYNY